MNNLNNWIFGDFFGNGKVDTIRWLMRDSAGIEISNSSDSVQFDKLVELRGSQNPSCYLIGSMTPNNGIKIASNKQLNGLTFFKNEGDLNNDGIDEFSYVIEWLDQSNHNTFHVSQIKVSQIQELFAFPIWEWQLYDLQESESLVNKIESGKIEYYFRNDDFEVVTAQIKLPN
ncbi:MAG: hypothetical protein KDC92_09055 [Bacteroidetes bacterium]|nr:hypothetical protein [Bacteroidota bacterium]